MPRSLTFPNVGWGKGLGALEPRTTRLGECPRGPESQTARFYHLEPLSRGPLEQRMPAHEDQDLS